MSGDTSYRIRGTSATLTAPPQASSLTNPRHIDLGLGRGGPGGEVQARGDDLARVELGNGFVLWSRLDDLLKERGRLERSRGGEELWSLTGESDDQARGGSRGALGTVIKALDLFGVDLEGRVALGLGEALENRLLGQSPGLYRVDLGDTWALSALPEGTGIPKANGPTLVFLHGTASSCKSSYSDAVGAGQLGRVGPAPGLRRATATGSIAWEHRSLTESPIANALGLAMLLQPGVELHLVSHSRGGLVGELLCLAAAGTSPPIC